MPAVRLRRYIAVLAVLALLLATSAYVTHEQGAGGLPHEALHCDLCLQFSGTAGPPASIVIPGRPVLIARLPSAPVSPAFSARREVGARLPRAPPAPAVI